MATINTFPPASSLVESFAPTAALFMQSRVPQLTGFRSLTGGMYPPGGAVGAFTPSDPLAEGGGSAAGAAANIVYGNSIFQTMKTGKWGYVYRAKLQVPTSGKTNRIATMNGAASRFIGFGTIFATDATKYVTIFESAIAATSVTADTNWHDFAMLSDGTTITAYIDFVSVATAAASSLTADEATYFSSFNTDAKVCMWSELTYGFVRP